jgi:hypothetical protein
MVDSEKLDVVVQTDAQHSVENSEVGATAMLNNATLNIDGAVARTEHELKSAKKRASLELASSLTMGLAATSSSGATSSPDDLLAIVQYEKHLEGVPPLPPVYISPRINNKKLKKGTDHSDDGMDTSEPLAGSYEERRRDQ